MDIADVHAELVSEIHYNMLCVGKAPIAELGDIFDELAAQFGALGICHLLEFADVGEFRTNLIRSGHSRRYFLRRSRAEGNVRDRHLALNRTNSVLDAVVAGDLALARQIADESTEVWNPDWEYEDDHCFFLLLHRMLQNPGTSPPPDAPVLLTRFERSLENRRSPRYEVCRALVARDSEGFDVSVSALLGEEAARNDEARDSAAVREGDVVYWPRSYLSLEGLALIKIAELLGMKVSGELARCPRIARLPWASHSVEDLFAAIEGLA
ncbi:Imm49 family immunity protein [Sorangium atrum]|uniref:Imm49 family immunity protein n=1 Tax=Sorangium atrum TaxID=2995308 RepID=A0ABT5BSL4_9BACT|nr:Imm49 family immunity protein [Sorangium aterium]MDC0677162.1 Imm49 family immunity protein [Sorangium aterium]